MMETWLSSFCAMRRLGKGMDTLQNRQNAPSKFWAVAMHAHDENTQEGHLQYCCSSQNESWCTTTENTQERTSHLPNSDSRRWNLDIGRFKVRASSASSWMIDHFHHDQQPWQEHCLTPTKQFLCSRNDDIVLIPSWCNNWYECSPAWWEHHHLCCTARTTHNKLLEDIKPSQIERGEQPNETYGCLQVSCWDPDPDS